MSNIAFLFLPLAFSSLPAVLPFVSPSSQVMLTGNAVAGRCDAWCSHMESGAWGNDVTLLAANHLLRRCKWSQIPEFLPPRGTSRRLCASVKIGGVLKWQCVCEHGLAL